MSPHQQRVIDEKADIDGQLERLLASMGGPIYEKLANAEKARMTRQAAIMRLLSNVLGERIGAFEEAP